LPICRIIEMKLVVREGLIEQKGVSKMRKLAVLLSLVVVATGCATGSSFVKPGYNFAALDKVAVVEVSGANNREVVQNEVADLFAMELLKRGYNVVERNQVDKILDEQGFQRSGATSALDPVEIGRILNVGAILIVNVPRLGQQISMTAKMTEVETASIVWMGEGTGKVASGVGTLTGALIGAGAGAAIGHQVRVGTGTTVGAIGGGLAGGAAGHVLEPTEARALRKVVAKVTRGMPGKL